MGYFGYAYYANNQKRLKAVAINGGKGPVLPSPQTVENGTYQPLSRPIFIYVNANSLNRNEVRQFAEYYLSNAARFAREVRYIPLPAQAYTLATRHLRNRRVGTVFGGEEAVGLRIEQLLQREAKQ